MEELPGFTVTGGESKGWVIILASAMTLALAAVTVTLRVFTRAIIVRCFGADDVCAILALATMIVSTAIGLHYLHFGLGRHVDELDDFRITASVKGLFLSMLAYTVSLGFTKLTFLLQIHRAAKSRTLRHCVMAAAILTGLWSLSFTISSIFWCVPVHKFWVPGVPGWCVNENTYVWTIGAGNIVTDLMIVGLSIPVVKNLGLALIHKGILCFIYLLGLFACGLSVVRAVSFELTTDISYDSALVICWSFGELGSGIVGACLATLRPLAASETPGATGDMNYKTRADTLDSTKTEKPAAYQSEGSPV